MSPSNPIECPDVEALLRSPRLVMIRERLDAVLDHERVLREQFYETLHEDQKVEFINGGVHRAITCKATSYPGHGRRRSREHGVMEYWIVDAELQTVEQYALRGDRYELVTKAKTGTIASVAREAIEQIASTVFP